MEGNPAINKNVSKFTHTSFLVITLPFPSLSFSLFHINKQTYKQQIYTKMLSTKSCTRMTARKAVSKTTTRQTVTRAAFDVKKAAATTALSFAVAFGANAATVKDGGGLAFVPSTVTIKKGESVTWVNNAAYPHNVVFDEDAVPAGVNADKLSHEDLLNGPGDSVSTKFDTPGTYEYYCEPHQGAGMQGKVVVE